MSKLDEGVKKAELVALQLSFGVNFKKNISILENYLPSLHKIFSKYQPADKVIKMDSNGYPNIFDSKGTPVYPENPEAYTKKQVDYFFRNSDPSVIKFRKKETIETGYIHQKFMSEINSVKYKTSYSRGDIDFCPTLFIYGVGFGYHINKIIEHLDVRNLCIYEPDFDCFYFSLFVVDWGKIVNYFSATGRNLEIVLGDKVEDAVRQLSLFFDRIGYYNLVQTQTFKHLSSSKINNVNQVIKNDISKLASAIGYYDDEKVGFAHTYENVGKGCAIGARSLGQRGDLAKDTLVLVGNGPSLDRAKEFLEAVKGKLPILSCGTTLGSLQRMGIKPDLHVEQERALSTFQWIKNDTTSEFRKGIRFVAMNTVYPPVLDLFDDPKIYVKPNDLGCQFLIENMVEEAGNSIAVADCGNPTVTNFGASLAMLLGYRNVILVGVDLGMRDPEDHHSKYSVYSTTDILVKNFRDKILSRGYFKQAANFGGSVYTTTVLDKSRMSFEDIIKRYKMKFLNTSDGILIKGSLPIDITDISVENLDGSAINNLDDRLIRSFRKNVVSLEDKDVVLERLNVVKKYLVDVRKFLNRTVTSQSDVHACLRDLHYYTKSYAKENAFFYMLIKGTVEYFSCIVTANIFDCDDEYLPDLYSAYADIFERYMYEISEDMLKNLFEFSAFDSYSQMVND